MVGANRVASVAGLALGLAGPGDTRPIAGEVVANLGHVAMAILTDDPGTAHGATQALGALARMTLVTGLLEDSGCSPTYAGPVVACPGTIAAR